MSESQSLWRLIDSGIVAPDYSAACDEAILNARLRRQVPETVHFYIRSEPTVSIGYNVAVEDAVVLDEALKHNVRIVRRFSGGSAIYTDRGQLIFAFIIDGKLLPSDIVESYGMICSAVVRGLSMLGVKAEHKPINDIVVGGLKISGSAQLRRGGVVLHHGTLLVDTDLGRMASVLKPVKGRRGDQAPSKGVTCIRDVLGRAPEMPEVKRALVRGFSEAFGVSLYPKSLTDGELSEIDRLVEEKYGTKEWNWRL